LAADRPLRSPEYQRTAASHNGVVRHARPEDLTPLAPVIERLRAVVGLTEKKPGTFYRGSRAFLHFHVDPAGLFADVRPGDTWERLPVDTPNQQRVLLEVVADATRPPG
jgi:hypothetical protein